LGNVVNLNKFRKRKGKAEATNTADTNRRLHGRTNSERTREELRQKQMNAVVDGAKLNGAEVTDDED
jgi:hypothetical protein